MRRSIPAALAVLLFAPASASALPATGSIGFGGIAGVAPGMPRADVEGGWGPPGSCRTYPTSSVCTWEAGRSAARIVFDNGDRVERIVLDGPKRGRPGALGRYRTRERVGLGTIVDRLVNAYPRDRFHDVNRGLVAVTRLSRDQSMVVAFTASPSRGGRVSRIVVGSNGLLGASRTFRPSAANALAAAGSLRMRLQYDVGVNVVTPNPDCREPTTAVSNLEASLRSVSSGYRVTVRLRRGSPRAGDIRNRLDQVLFSGFERVRRIGMGVGAFGDVRMRASGLCDDHGGELDMSGCRNHPRWLYFQPQISLIRGSGRRYAYVTTSPLQSADGGLDNVLLPGCGDVNMRLAIRPLAFVVPADRLLSGSGSVRVPAVGNGTEVITDHESGLQRTTTQHAFLIISRGRAGAAQSEPPACEPSKNGFLVNPRVDDPNGRPGSRALYATHRLQVRASADIDALDDPDGSQYNIETNSERLAPGSGAVGRLELVRDTPGPFGVPVLWTVTRGLFGEPKTPYCTGSETIPVTLRTPTPTSLSAERLLVDRTGASPRVQLALAGRPSDDLRPVSIRIRRGARGKARTLFTLPLADVRADTARYRFSKRFAGVRITSGPRDASLSARGLVMVGVSVPKLGHGRRLRRDFTLEVVRERRVLMRVRAVLSCRGFGTLVPTQDCRTPVWRVARPTR